MAQQRLEQIVREKQLESIGILPPQAIRNASQTPLTKHLCDYVTDLQAVGRDTQYICELKNRIHRLMRECLWKQVKDISSNSLLAWRAKQTLAPKTVNEYLMSISSLLNWMEKHERIERNPLRHVQEGTELWHANLPLSCFYPRGSPKALTSFKPILSFM